jgi:hypothetical protein
MLEDPDKTVEQLNFALRVVRSAPHEFQSPQELRLQIEQLLAEAKHAATDSRNPFGDPLEEERPRANVDAPPPDDPSGEDGDGK